MAQSASQPCKVFCGGLSWETTSERLRAYFENFGVVREAFVSYNRESGRPRGFGFVVFESPEVADKVVAAKHMVDRREVECKRAQPREDNPTMSSSSSVDNGPSQASRASRKIFIGGLSPVVDEKQLRSHFQQFGDIEDAVVMYDHENQRPRGFGFITFMSEESVDKVFSGGALQTIADKQCEIKAAVPRDQMPSPYSRPSNGFPPYPNGWAAYGNYPPEYSWGLQHGPPNGYSNGYGSRGGFSPRGPPMAPPPPPPPMYSGRMGVPRPGRYAGPLGPNSHAGFQGTPGRGWGASSQQASSGPRPPVPSKVPQPQAQPNHSGQHQQQAQQPQQQPSQQQSQQQHQQAMAAVAGYEQLYQAAAAGIRNGSAVSMFGSNAATLYNLAGLSAPMGNSQSSQSTAAQQLEAFGNNGLNLKALALASTLSNFQGSRPDSYQAESTTFASSDAASDYAAAEAAATLNATAAGATSLSVSGDYHSYSQHSFNTAPAPGWSS